MIGGHWFATRDGDPRALGLYLRHYSAQKNRRGALSAAPGNASRFAGPGEHMVLLTTRCDALFVWRAERFRADGQVGVGCSVFRNEGPVRSSVLIAEAVALAWQRWPGERLFTYVDPRSVASANPGYCFKRAGWQLVRRDDGQPFTSTRGLLLLELLPTAEALAA